MIDPRGASRRLPPLADGAVDVWRADLATADDALAALLAPDEAERAAGFVREQDGWRWARARGILRSLLGGYLELDPRALRLATGEHGKPELVEPTVSLRFNVSHSGDVAVYAFADGRAVGVDVEVPRRPLDHVALAARAFGPEEARRLGALEPASREREFLRAWVRHEAELKCRGSGIGGPSPEPGDPPVWIAELDVGRGAAAAVAVVGAPCEIRLREFAA
jgi:4'-phosphopantetheinyl transferase